MVVSYQKPLLILSLSSGGQTRTADLTIMSRALLPTELRRHLTYCHLLSPLPDLNRRPLPYHGSALPTELRGPVPRVGFEPTKA